MLQQALSKVQRDLAKSNSELESERSKILIVVRMIVCVPVRLSSGMVHSGFEV